MKRAKQALYVVHFKRRRLFKTNYKKRLALLKSRLPRLVARKSNRFFYVQFVEFGEKGDKTIAAACSRELRKSGFAGKCNTPSAYLTGLLAGKRALAKGVKKFVLDAGLHSASKGSILFAALKGAVDAGLATNFAEEIMPSAERIEGKHLAEAVQKSFLEVKQKILAG